MMEILEKVRSIIFDISFGVINTISKIFTKLNTYENINVYDYNQHSRSTFLILFLLPFILFLNVISNKLRNIIPISSITGNANNSKYFLVFSKYISYFSCITIIGFISSRCSIDILLEYFKRNPNLFAKQLIYFSYDIFNKGALFWTSIWMRTKHAFMLKLLFFIIFNILFFYIAYKIIKSRKAISKKEKNTKIEKIKNVNKNRYTEKFIII